MAAESFLPSDALDGTAWDIVLFSDIVPPPVKPSVPVIDIVFNAWLPSSPSSDQFAAVFVSPLNTYSLELYDTTSPFIHTSCPLTVAPLAPLGSVVYTPIQCIALVRAEKSNVSVWFFADVICPYEFTVNLGTLIDFDEPGATGISVLLFVP